jgi:hypothetical protein
MTVRSVIDPVKEPDRANGIVLAQLFAIKKMPRGVRLRLEATRIPHAAMEIVARQ